MAQSDQHTLTASSHNHENDTPGPAYLYHCATTYQVSRPAQQWNSHLGAPDPISNPYARQPDPQAEDITPAEVNAAVAHLYGVRREPVTLDSLCIGLRIRETQDRKINGLIKKLEEHPRAQRMAREVTGCVSFRYWPPMHITNGDELLRFLRDPGTEILSIAAVQESWPDCEPVVMHSVQQRVLHASFDARTGRVDTFWLADRKAGSVR